MWQKGSLPILGVLCALAAACGRAGVAASGPQLTVEREASRGRSRGAARPVGESVRGAGGPAGRAFVACGGRFDAGTRVVLWDEPGGYDANRASPACDGRAPFGTRRGLRDAGNVALPELQDVVTQVVVHYDAAATSCNCFRILHEKRGLSCHFLLDADGTVYQTLDVAARAWHASEANDRSIGIEIANIGAYADAAPLSGFYTVDAEGDVRLALPRWVPRGALPADFAPRPARPVLLAGPIHGARLVQYDYTDAQYEALGRLLAALVRVFPRLQADAPRGADGSVLAHTLADPAAFRGIVGHYHLTRGKLDPGPAFDWNRVLGDVHTRIR